MRPPPTSRTGTAQRWRNRTCRGTVRRGGCPYVVVLPSCAYIYHSAFELCDGVARKPCVIGLPQGMGRFLRYAYGGVITRPVMKRLFVLFLCAIPVFGQSTSGELR